MVEIRNSGDLRKWLLTMPPEVGGIIAARIAVRVWPLARTYVLADPDTRRAALLLPMFRATALPWAAAECSAQGETDVKDAAHATALAARAALAADATAYAATAHAALATALAADATAHAADAAAHAT
ncbi:MAG: hypothetical protein ACFB03_12870, partial [Paracoccaceae bacterium]